jgi:hypothetical protein
VSLDEKRVWRKETEKLEDPHAELMLRSIPLTGYLAPDPERAWLGHCAIVPGLVETVYAADTALNDEQLHS